MPGSFRMPSISLSHHPNDKEWHRFMGFHAVIYNNNRMTTNSWPSVICHSGSMIWFRFDMHGDLKPLLQLYLYLHGYYHIICLCARIFFHFLFSFSLILFHFIFTFIVLFVMNSIWIERNVGDFRLDVYILLLLLLYHVNQSLLSCVAWNATKICKHIWYLNCMEIKRPI